MQKYAKYNCNEIQNAYYNKFRTILINTIGLRTTYFIPATPSTTKSSLVKVPVLSKQQTSTLPANGIRKGSVQNTPRKETNINAAFLRKITHGT